VAADPLRMHLVMRRGAVESIARGGELSGAAAVACVRRFATDPAYDEAFAAWTPRPGKIMLRARGGQWAQLLAEEPHALAGDPDGEAVAALPPRRQSERSELLRRMQAMSSELEPAPDDDAPAPADGLVTYILNPDAAMSSGKTLAQVAHAAVIAAGSGRLEAWVAAGCPARVITTSAGMFAALTGDAACVAEVVDAGLTEVPPGTVTVRALAPRGR
jgi:peptidyl-tRNA hydrolase